MQIQNQVSVGVSRDPKYMATVVNDKLNNLMPKNLASSLTYQGNNLINLLTVSIDRKYTSGVWASYRQWAERGYQVKKGEKGTKIVYFKSDETENKNENEKKGRLLKSSYVFNKDQTDVEEQIVAGLDAMEKGIKI